MHERTAHPRSASAKSAIEKKLSAYEQDGTALELDAREVSLLRSLLMEKRATTPKGGTRRDRRVSAGIIFSDLVAKMKLGGTGDPEDDANVDLMISAFGAAPPSAAIRQRVSEDASETARHAIKQVIATSRVVNAFGGGGELKAVDPLLPAPLAARIAPALGDVDSWDFDLFAIVDAVGGDKPLAAKVVSEEVILTRRGCAPDGAFREVVRSCIADLVDGYEDVLYHNCLHGVDCMQSFHAVSRASPRFDAALVATDPRAHLVALLAALAHDIGHVGLTNAYLIETQHPFAVNYNDQSPLENYHAATGLKIVDGNGLWEPFAPRERRLARLTWIETVLATDMSHHTACCAGLDALLGEAGDAGDAAAPANNLQVLKALVHACDLGGPTKPLQTHLKWTDLVMEEFYDQAEKELANGKEKPSLPVRGSVNLGKFQLAFIGFIHPLFAKINQLPSINFETPLKNVDIVRNHWTASLDKPAPVSLPTLK